MLDSQIEGENTTVAQLSLRARLGNAEWELAQTSVQAPTDGYVTLSALTVGHWVTLFRMVMSFLVADDIVTRGRLLEHRTFTRIHSPRR
jgi:multidrug resistance efflux pump